MRNASWLALFVMSFFLSCGGSTTPVGDGKGLVQSEETEEKLTKEESTEQQTPNIEEAKPQGTMRLPSDTIFLEDGIIDGYELKITKSGSEERPLVLSARHPGKTVITGNVRIEISGSYVHVVDLIFKNVQSVGKYVDVIKFTGNRNKLSNCIIYNTDNFKSEKTYYWVTIDGKRNEVRGNSFVGKSNKGPLVYVVAEDARNGHHDISQNLFARIKPLGENGLSTIRIGLKSTEPVSSFTTVMGNVFHNCDGEIELISSKASNNSFINNLVYESRGGLTLRWGNDCKVDGNQFISKKNTSIGVRVAGSGHEIKNNTFKLVGGPNAAAIVLMTGSKNTECGYQPARDISIHDNEFHNNSDWKILEQVNCDAGPQFLAKDNFKFKNGQPKGKGSDYSVERKVVSTKRKGNSKILKEIYVMKALEGEGEKESTPKVQMPDLSIRTRLESNEGFITSWVRASHRINNAKVGSTIKVSSL